MSRLVVISNRVSDPRKVAAGGLAVALGDALATSGGLWFGWSGKIVEGGASGEGELHQQRAGNVELVTIDLSREDHDTYYTGYSNQALWPAFHYRLDLADFGSGFFAGYQRVNRLFARKLAPLLRDDDVIWVHDYHLIPLASELRSLGCRQRIGFFLHIPLPPPPILAAIPGHEWLMRSFFAYDLVGLQTHEDADHFARFLVGEAHAERLPDGRFSAYGRTMRAQAFPIGIDVDEFQGLAESAESRETEATLKQQYAHRRLLVGIDRLDYSKGLPRRLRAFRELLDNYPENRNSATLIQIASPTRESVDAYADIRHELEGLAGEINGTYGELAWMPIRYMHRTWARKRLPGLYRAAKVALVTPLRDGMNLVAKEYVAMQDEDDPGVLVLSRFAGAAEQMREALLVNPYDIPATAQTIQRALQMPLAERRERHAALLKRIREYDVHAWRKDFLGVLAEAAPPPPVV
ncbi:alpha,alpha-trehalose-phosphate synthase (UDP-forming) [Aquincola tertiaricarbonis]|uniref:alpha,alpha-trehalose-phosphate synthase (UDP-forming) n=1 Tax=Aquincola tertiaricarbonis TaxID=391953 RepID=UPI0006153C15|nr:alpha,alpha-trehalose-phosphate synthase (UDP-forming) [Aquincola tertiaricarbonis]